MTLLRSLCALVAIVFPALTAEAHMTAPVRFVHESNITQVMLLRGGVTTSAVNPYGNNACGVSTIPFCIMPDGWSKITATPRASGVCSNSGSNSDGSCVVPVDRNPAASFVASTATNQLTILSGAPPTAGQTLVMAGVTAGTTIGVTCGASCFTLSTTPGTIGSIAAYSIAGNDTTCAAQQAGAVLTTEDLPSLVAATPCATLAVGQTKLRNLKSDWLVAKKGGAKITADISGNTLNVSAVASGSLALGHVFTEGPAKSRAITAGSGSTWTINGPAMGTVASQAMETAVDYGLLNGTNGNLVNKNGPPITGPAGPLLITAYGSGNRPLMMRTSKANDGILKLQGSGGNNLGILGLRLYDSINDPISPYWVGATIVGDTGTTNGCATNTEICNITGGVPSRVVGGSVYFAWGTGVSNVAVTAVTGTSITLNTTIPSAARGVGVIYQLEDRSGAAVVQGFNSAAASDFLLIEDVRADHGQFVLQQTLTTAQTPNILFRRNMIDYAWSFANGACIYNGSSYISGVQFVVEENVCNYGGINPFRWSGYSSPFNHGFYQHDPSTGIDDKANIVANGAATGIQYREASIFYNNLLISNPVGVSINVKDHNFVGTYNIVTNGTDGNLGYRTAICAAPPCNSGTTISFEGIAVSGAGQFDIRNLTNPGSVYGRIDMTSGILSATSATLGASYIGPTVGLSAGVRGDGVKSGDVLEFVTTQNKGAFIGRNGTLLSAGPANTTDGEYLGPTTVDIDTTADTITETGGVTKVRVGDAPFTIDVAAAGLPPEISIGQTICTDSQSSVYKVYFPTAGVCVPGTTTINFTGANKTGVTRSGERKFLFNVGLPTVQPVTWAGVPAWVTPGMPVTASGSSAFSCGRATPFWTGQTTTVDYIPPASGGQISYLYLTDPITNILSGKDNGQISFNFGGVGQASAATSAFGPNNVFTLANNTIGAPSGINAITGGACTWGANAANNYIYGWSDISTADNFVDNTTTNPVTPPGGTAYSATNFINAASQVLATTSNTKYLEANIQAVDADLRGTTCMVTTAAPVAPATGSVVSIAGACVPPIAGDMAFDASGSHPLPWATGIPPGQTIGSTFYVDKALTTIGTPFAMKFGSDARYLSLALSQSKETGWNLLYGANYANNKIRTNIKCGDTTEHGPSTPACPAQ